MFTYDDDHDSATRERSGDEAAPHRHAPVRSETPPQQPTTRDRYFEPGQYARPVDNPEFRRFHPVTPASVVEQPETCRPPAMSCPPAVNSPTPVNNRIVFPRDVWALTTAQIKEVDDAAAFWRRGGATVRVRVDGYASAEGPCHYNWRLSCLRAQSVAHALEHPSDRSAGVTATSIDRFAHGETNEASPALAGNRLATISIPLRPVPPPPPHHIPVPTPTCPLPRSIGVGRRCNPRAADIQHFDFPSISWSSAVKLALWAAAHVPPRGTRWLVTDAECLTEMAAVLGLGLGGGMRAFARFTAGTGGTDVLDPTSFLGAMALLAPSFLASVARVRAAIESQLSGQAGSGVLDPCSLRVTPPATFFSVSDGIPLKAVIGGTQGEELFVLSFTGSASARTYTITVQFDICDHFGVDESDLYAPGLIPFWVLQHERNPVLYKPFIHLLRLPVTLTGTF